MKRCGLGKESENGKFFVSGKRYWKKPMGFKRATIQGMDFFLKGSRW